MSAYDADNGIRLPLDRTCSRGIRMPALDTEVAGACARRTAPVEQDVRRILGLPRAPTASIAR